MKTLKQILAIAIVAAALVKLTPDLHQGRFVSPFAPLEAVHAQQAGFIGGYNIHFYYLGADASDNTAQSATLNKLGDGSGATGQPFAWTMPASPIAQRYWYDCQLSYAQTTAATADQFGWQFSAAPTASQHFFLYHNGAANTAPLDSTPINISGTSATAVAAFTPAAATTVWPLRMWGTVEQPASNIDTIVNLMVSHTTAGDNITVKRGGVCMVQVMQ